MAEQRTSNSVEGREYGLESYTDGSKLFVSMG
jgi:hypothetical protein